MNKTAIVYKSLDKVFLLKKDTSRLIEQIFCLEEYLFLINDLFSI